MLSSQSSKGRNKENIKINDYYSLGYDAKTIKYGRYQSEFPRDVGF